MADSMNGADPGLTELIPLYRDRWTITRLKEGGYRAVPRPHRAGGPEYVADTAEGLAALLGPTDQERASGTADTRVTVRLYLRGDDAERMLAADLAGEGRWELLDVLDGEAYRPYAVERSAADPSGPAAAGAALRRVREDAERWEQVTGRRPGP